MDDVETLRAIVNKTRNVEGEIKTTLAEIVQLEKTVQHDRNEHLRLTELAANDLQASEIIKILFDKLSEKGFHFLENLGTQALQIVFPDESYSFKINVGSRGAERTSEFFLVDGGKEIPLSETGGGVQVLLAFVFRVYFILQYKLRRVIVMDEAFAQLSPQYLETLLQFLHDLVKHFEFKILWISHSPYLEGRVTKFYQMVKGRLMVR